MLTPPLPVLFALAMASTHEPSVAAPKMIYTAPQQVATDAYERAASAKHERTRTMNALRVCAKHYTMLLEKETDPEKRKLLRREYAFTRAARTLELFEASSTSDCELLGSVLGKQALQSFYELNVDAFMTAKHVATNERIRVAAIRVIEKQLGKEKSFRLRSRFRD